MKCYYHPEEEAVGQCVDCGKFLCKECASKYKPVLCDDCYETRRRNNELDLLDEAKGFSKAYIKSVVIGIIVAISVFRLTMDDGGMYRDSLTILYRVIFAFMCFLFTFGLLSRSGEEYLEDAVASTNNTNLVGLIIRGFIFGFRFFIWMPEFIKAQKIIKQYK